MDQGISQPCILTNAEVPILVLLEGLKMIGMKRGRSVIEKIP